MFHDLAERCFRNTTSLSQRKGSCVLNTSTARSYKQLCFMSSKSGVPGHHQTTRKDSCFLNTPAVRFFKNSYVSLYHRYVFHEDITNALATYQLLLKYAIKHIVYTAVFHNPKEECFTHIASTHEKTAAPERHRQ